MGCGGRGKAGRAEMMAGRVEQTCERSGARDERRLRADGEAVWSWHPLLVSSRAEVLRAQPGSAKP
jgi:hypothetical protein